MSFAVALRASDLVGTWRLRSWELMLEAGGSEEPFGSDPQGIVVYTAGGTMITTIGSRHRVPDGRDLASGTDAARLAAVTSFVAYSGTFRVEERDVVHVVEMSLDPAWVGTEQRRHVELVGERSALILSTDPLLVAGRTGRHRLTWERIEG